LALVKHAFLQILDAVDYCHSIGISKSSVNKGLGILSILKQISQKDGLETVKLPIG
jgi:hypothetical protein